MASAVAKRSNHRATRSASWSVMHSDEELARILQMQEEKEYQDHLAAKEVQCQSDHQLARLLSKHDGHLPGGMNLDEFQDARHPTRPPTTSRNASNSNGPPPRSRSQNATAISVTDSDTDFSDCFEDTTFDDELSTALERDRTAADSQAERQDAADALIRNDEIAEALQNDEQLNRMGENELSWSMGEPGNASYNPVVVSPGSEASGISVSRLDLSNLGNEPMELSRVSVDGSNDGDWVSANESAFSPESASANNSLLTSVNIAWNAVGSAVNWVSELFSGAQPPVQSGIGNRVTVHPAGDAEEEEDDDEEEEGCEEDDDDDGWEDEDSDDLGDLDDGDDIDDDEVAAFDMIDSDMDDSDDDNVDPLEVFRVNAVPGRGRGLVPSEIDVLPTRTYQSRPPQTATSGAADAAGASENQRQNECQVCLSSFADGEVLRTLPCCHLFHSECIDVWLQRNAICPVCRVRIRDEIGCR